MKRKETTRVPSSASRKRTAASTTGEDLRKLQERAEAMIRGDYSELGKSLGGSRAAEDLRRALDVIATHAQQAQVDSEDYVAGLVTAQETERTRIARELHDDAVQRLIALSQDTERAGRLVERSPQQAASSFKAIRAEIVALTQSLREVIGDLRPPALEDLGLIAAVEMLVGRSGARDLKVEISMQGEERRLDARAELGLFRIIQEAWSNIVRHSNARRVQLRFTFAEDELRVAILDDGQGFEISPEGVTAHPGWGLRNMRERAALAGGQLRVVSAPGEGTAIYVHMPSPGAALRDPVCGMVVGPDSLSLTHERERYYFCSPACADLFAAQPQRFIKPA
jgi:signal transduction histidine kinase/YHS domain-containing protein